MTCADITQREVRWKAKHTLDNSCISASAPQIIRNQHIWTRLMKSPSLFRNNGISVGTLLSYIYFHGTAFKFYIRTKKGNRYYWKILTPTKKSTPLFFSDFTRCFIHEMTELIKFAPRKSCPVILVGHVSCLHSVTECVLTPITK